MKKRILVPLSVSILTLFSGCTCKPEVIVKKEYIDCKKPTILDLNYTSDTNYTIPSLDYEVIEDFRYAKSSE